MTHVSELLLTKIKLTIEQSKNLELQFAQMQASAKAIHQEREQLIEQARIEAGAAAGHRLNLDTGTFEAPAGPVPLQAPQSRQQRRVSGKRA
jgi:hypothetical protein